jgi:thioesterase domain-containing protein
MQSAAAAVVLVHGMGRTPLSMLWLAWRLRRAGLRTHLFGYSATFESFARIAGRLARLMELGRRPYIGVGHSLGGLLLRVAASQLTPPKLKPMHLLMLGTPNRSPRLARALRHWRSFRALNGDCGQLLSDPPRMDALPPLEMPATVVAGTSGWNGRWSPFADEPNDGVVAVSEAELNGASLIQLPLRHTFLMNSKRVAHIALGCAREPNSDGDAR